MTPTVLGSVGPRALDAELPRTAAEVAAIVREAGAAHEGLRLAGCGSWLDAGHAVRATRTVSLRGISGITSYVPADLTISCGAGTTILELDEATRAHGQWCPLAPPGMDLTSTVGATVATAMESPYAATLGRPRSLVLGLECVDGTGRVIAAGGRVVKNVAGFDLTRAMIGAWGTLGAITQVHLRLRARPVVDECWSLRLELDGLARLEAYVRGPLAPLACVRHEPPDAPRGGAHHWYLVRIGGNSAFVAESRAALQALGDTIPQGPSAMDAWRGSHEPPPRALQWRWDAIAIRLRDRFDPHRMMNPGLLGEPT